MINFISETYLRENTTLSKNLDIKDIVPNIDVASQMHIEPVLGTNFYNEILGKYQVAYANPSASTLTTNEQNLINEIRPALAYWSAKMSLPFVTTPIFNKGPQSMNGDFSNSIDQSGMNFLSNELKNRAEFMTSRLTNYLCRNGNLFSGYTSNNSTDMVPTNKVYDSGFGLYPIGGCNLFYNRNNFY